jgi:hypothetical protein
MIDVQTARQLVLEYLRKVEGRMTEMDFNDPGHERKSRFHVVITRTTECDFGWVFFFDLKEFLGVSEPTHILAGNSPLIVDKNDGQVYLTGTGRPIEHYIDQYRKGVRTRA